MYATLLVAYKKVDHSNESINICYFCNMGTGISTGQAGG